MKPKKIDLGQIKKKFGPYGAPKADGDLVVFYVSAYNEDEADEIAQRIALTITTQQIPPVNHATFPEPSLN
jgi:hypothetical protein